MQPTTNLAISRLHDRQPGARSTADPREGGAGGLEKLREKCESRGVERQELETESEGSGVRGGKRPTDVRVEAEREVRPRLSEVQDDLLTNVQPEIGAP